MTEYKQRSMAENIGLRIRSRRLDLKMTQKELADSIGVTFQQVQKYESGRCQLSLTAFAKVCVELRASPNYFISDILKLEDGVDDVELGLDLEAELLTIFRSINGRKSKTRILRLIEAIVMETAGPRK
jgi:transcriptional regulator with XRE-family HTH domain